MTDPSGFTADFMSEGRWGGNALQYGSLGAMGAALAYGIGTEIGKAWSAGSAGGSAASAASTGSPGLAGAPVGAASIGLNASRRF